MTVGATRTRKPMGKPAYFGLLALACLVGLALVTLPIWSSGRGLVWLPDTMAEQVGSLIYGGEMLRAAFESLFAGNGFDLASYEFGNGYGSTMRAEFAIGDPLKWLAMFVPPEGEEFLLYAIVYMRLYLAAVFFSLYCFECGSSKGTAFVSALCYAFSGFALFWAILRHPSFLNALLMLPLVLLGAEKLFRRKSPVVLSVGVALSLFLSSYFAYMTIIALVAYCLVRFLVLADDRTPAAFAKLVGKFVLFGGIGVAIAGVALAPSIASLTSMNRVSQASSVYVPLVNDIAYYGSFVARLVGTVASHSTAKYIGCVAVFACAVLLFCPRLFPKREAVAQGTTIAHEGGRPACAGARSDDAVPVAHSPHRVRIAWLVGVALVLVVAFVPKLASVMNGSNYVTDRWMFILAFVAANVVRVVLPVVARMKRREWVRVGAFMAAVILLAIVPLPFDDVQTALPLAMLVVLAVTVAVMFARSNGRLAARSFHAVAACLVLVSSGTAAFFLTSEQFGQGYADEFLPKVGTAQSYFADASPYAAVEELPAAERAQHRYSMATNFDLKYQNNSLGRDRMGLENFHSNYVQSVDDLRNELGIPDNFYRSYYYGSDGRLAVDALSAAKFFVANERSAWRVPATYESTGLEANGARVYETDFALPLGFVSDGVLPRSAYEQLDMAGKQAALLQACVLPDDAVAEGSVVLGTPGSGEGAIDALVVPKSFTLKVGEGAKLASDAATGEGGDARKGSEGTGSGSVTVSKAGAVLRFEFDPQPYSETYLLIENMRLDDASLKSGDIDSRDSFALKVASENGERNYKPKTPLAAQTYSGKTSWISNMGQSEQGIGWIELTFAEKGTYLFDGLKVECQPIEPVKQRLRALQARALTDIQMTRRSISGTATLASTSVAGYDGRVEYAVFTVGHSRGWTATVDGQPADVLRADTGFMAVPVQGAGAHRVELTYETPGLRLGAALSAVGVLALVVTVVVGARARARRKRV